MNRLIFVGDAVCSSGFGKATHHIAQHLAENFELFAIGINYQGEPHEEPYHIWPAYIGGDPIGVGQLRKLLPRLRPDVIVLQVNPWHVPPFMKVINDAVKSGAKRPIVIGIIAVEGKNCKGSDMKGLDHAIFWTEFGRREARGWEGPSSIVPLGVDLDVYKPGDKIEARKAIGLPEDCFDAFILGNINRNQNRKRLDLSIQYFAEWYHAHGRPNAYLYLHALPGSSTQVDLDQLADYYGVQARMILPVFKDFFAGVIEKWVVTTYQTFDVGINTGLGEGWGLTTMEGMACGTPQIATRSSAVPEWAGDAVRLIPVSSWGVMPDVYTMIGGVPDAAESVKAIHEMYSNRGYREMMGRAALACVSDPRFRWPNVGAAFARAIEEAARGVQ
jgi:D-inositol-3-phosphate glycosyltransferase